MVGRMSGVGAPSYAAHIALNKTARTPSMPEQITRLDPILSIFDSAEEEADYTAWLQAKVAAALADPRPSIPHDEVERRMALRLANLRKQHDAKATS